MVAFVITKTAPIIQGHSGQGMTWGERSWDSTTAWQPESSGVSREKGLEKRQVGMMKHNTHRRGSRTSAAHGRAQADLTPAPDPESSTQAQHCLRGASEDTKVDKSIGQSPKAWPVKTDEHTV